MATTGVGTMKNFIDGAWVEPSGGTDTPGERSLALIRLIRLADAIEEHGDEIAALEIANAGKPAAAFKGDELPVMADNLSQRQRQRERVAGLDDCQDVARTYGAWDGLEDVAGFLRGAPVRVLAADAQ